MGWLSNGERHVLRTGINVKDLKSAIDDLSNLLNGFEKKNRKAASRPASRTQSDSGENQIPLLAGSNFDSVCGEKTPVCVIGAFRSSKARNKLESILNMVRTLIFKYIYFSSRLGWKSNTSLPFHSFFG